MGVAVAIKETPNEVPNPIRFSQDRIHASYDATAAHRFWRALVQADRVFKLFRSGFLGKASPVHFFWGSFDLAVTRFSGRRAPLHPGGVPGLPDAVVREAYSHEVSSAGFWPGARPFRARPSTPTPIPNRLAFATGRSRPAPISIRRSESSSCLTTRSRKRGSRTPCCSTSCRRPMSPQPRPAAGTAPIWNARSGFRDGSARYRREQMVAWDRVTRADVVRAIKEYDRLGPERSSLSVASPRQRLMSWRGKNTVTRRKQSWARRMSSLRASGLAPVTSRAGRPAPSGCSGSSDSPSRRSDDRPGKAQPEFDPRLLRRQFPGHIRPRFL